MTESEHINVALKSLTENLAKGLFDMTRDEAWEQGICIRCKEPPTPKCYSKAGLKEYTQSALCEECFDEITGGE